MKNTIKLLAVCALVFSCQSGPTPPPPTPKQITITKTIKAKKEKIESGTRWKYSIWSDRFYPVSDVKTVYYFIFTDGTIEQVDMATFVKLEEGEKYTKTQTQFP